MLPYRVKGSTGSFSSVGCPNQLNARAELGNPPTFATNITMIITTVMHLVFAISSSPCLVWRLLHISIETLFCILCNKLNGKEEMFPSLLFQSENLLLARHKKGCQTNLYELLLQSVFVDIDPKMIWFGCITDLLNITDSASTWFGCLTILLNILDSQSTWFELHLDPRFGMTVINWLIFLVGKDAQIVRPSSVQHPPPCTWFSKETRTHKTTQITLENCPDYKTWSMKTIRNFWLQETKTKNSSQRTFTKKQVLQTDTKLSKEPSNLGLFGKKPTIGNEDVANMSFIEPTVHVCTMYMDHRNKDSSLKRVP
jgi:hypothetical protein